MDIEAWANGQKPNAKATAAEWFAEHPGLAEEAIEAHDVKQYSWQQVHAWLVAEYGYPLGDPKTMTRALR